MLDRAEKWAQRQTWDKRVEAWASMLGHMQGDEQRLFNGGPLPLRSRNLDVEVPRFFEVRNQPEEALLGYARAAGEEDRSAYTYSGLLRWGALCSRIRKHNMEECERIYLTAVTLWPRMPQPYYELAIINHM